MDKTGAKDRISELKNEIKELPQGYISKKNINGKIRYYYQWSQMGKIKSKYIKEVELEKLQADIEHRRALQKELKTLERKMPKVKHIPLSEFKTNVTAGQKLIEMTETVKNYEKRDCFELLESFLSMPKEPRVCLLYGLRRTGKTTMLYQAIWNMSPEDLDKTVYIKAREEDTMSDLDKDLTLLYDNGIRYVFIDEVTLIKDFIDSAAVLSDIHAAIGMKIVLSGTDSLGFWLAESQELYDRAYSIHTTIIPFEEYSRILKINDIDEYIRYGGTLRAGETDFDDKKLLSGKSAFYNDDSTRKYVDTAISKNIQHSLACCEDGRQFRHLYSLYKANELTGAINRIIEDMNHRFILEVLTRDFKSNDLHLSAKNLRKDATLAENRRILDEIDADAVTKRLMEILEIRNAKDQKIEVTNTHVEEIKEYLKALDLIYYTDVETTIPGAEAYENVVFTQPGMRYCQAQALVHSLMKDRMLNEQSQKLKEYVSERILDEVKGRMLEDIVLMETSKKLNSEKYMVFQLKFATGEFDMVIYDREEDVCRIYEVKHSDKFDGNQYRHLEDEEKCALTERRFGKIVSKTVLYRGKDFETEEGIIYRNVEKYLKELNQDTMFGLTADDISEKIGMDFNL